MPGMRAAAIRAGLETLYFTGAHRLAGPMFAGAGAILTFHRVRPISGAPFQPNSGLEIDPAFLEATVSALRHADVDIVSMDEAWRRLVAGDDGRRFVVLTFDDGYRDNYENAWPMLKEQQVPFTIFVVPAFADGTGLLWWETLEAAVAQNTRLEIDMDGERRRFDCAGPSAKDETFWTIYSWLRGKDRDADLRKAIVGLASSCAIDTEAQCREACMGWSELSEMSADPLVTIGAHTMTHPFLAKLDAESARAEMADSRRVIGEKLGVVPDHFAYPVGAPDAAGPREFGMAAEIGYKTAVTTRPGVVFADHSRHLTALPRISVNGDFQRSRFVDVLLSGVPTAFLNRFRRVDAA